MVGHKVLHKLEVGYCRVYLILFATVPPAGCNVLGSLVSESNQTSDYLVRLDSYQHRAMVS